ncbi:MAG: dTDP-4-dehydrorhamnose reductase [Gammaproteobacteria bacterium SHHR-1]|uniref:dTDP-4-dehydrorhamnose reductase n=1 Tax=Magnetovirga frankeli TaxID=947516 RepID=UPI00129338A5|nr:dTDP-4-dehydrorhamnose reductase [gamma proteobacterium SS-5]
MNILLLGKNGQLGWELQRALAPLGEVVALDQDRADFAQPETLVPLLDQLQPGLIVNAAAHTAVDKAESEPELSQRINADAVAELARWAAQHRVWLIHYSTDYVFDGSAAGWYSEEDASNPLSVYGRTKLAGEQALAASGCHHLTLRTSWVYASRGKNFARTMLQLAASRESLSVVADQWGAPTSAELLADVTALCLYRLRQEGEGAGHLSGLYHLVAAGETNWCDYARFVLQQAQQRGTQLKVGPEQVKAISTAEYPTPAQRPLNSRLATDKLRQAFGLTLPDWRYHAARQIDELLGS